MVQNVSIPGVSNATVPAKPSSGSAANPVVPQDGVVPAEAATGVTVNPVPPEPAPDSKKDQPAPRGGVGVPSRPVQNMLSIAHDEAANRYVYRGVDNATKEVKVQWPTEQALKRMALMREMSGQLFDEES